MGQESEWLGSVIQMLCAYVTDPNKTPGTQGSGELLWLATPNVFLHTTARKSKCVLVTTPGKDT